MFHIYVIVNYTMNEGYVGTTHYEDVEDRIAEHPDNVEVNHWDFYHDDIAWDKLFDKYEFENQEEAIDMRDKIRAKLESLKMKSIQPLMVASCLEVS